MNADAIIRLRFSLAALEQDLSEELLEAAERGERAGACYAAVRRVEELRAQLESGERAPEDILADARALAERNAGWRSLTDGVKTIDRHLAA